MSIPFPDHAMPGYFVPASGHPAGTRRPLLICTNGYDASLSSVLVYSALAARATGGWSLGGYLAPRGASGEHRLAACIADPGMPGQADVMRSRLEAQGLGADQAAHLDALPDDLVSTIVAGGSQTRDGRWRMEQRAPFVHGVATAAEAVRALAPYSDWLDATLAPA